MSWYFIGSVFYLDSRLRGNDDLISISLAQQIVRRSGLRKNPFVRLRYANRTYLTDFSNQRLEFLSGAVFGEKLPHQLQAIHQVLTRSRNTPDGSALLYRDCTVKSFTPFLYLSGQNDAPDPSGYATAMKT